MLSDHRIDTPNGPSTGRVLLAAILRGSPARKASERSAGSFAGSNGIPPSTPGRSAAWQRASFGTRRPAVRIRPTRPAARRQRDVAQMAAHRFGEPEVAGSSPTVSTVSRTASGADDVWPRQHDACRRDAGPRRRLTPRGPSPRHGRAARRRAATPHSPVRLRVPCPSTTGTVRLQEGHWPFKPAGEGSNPSRCTHRGVEQLVAREPHKLKVAGSSPATPTTPT